MGEDMFAVAEKLPVRIREDGEVDNETVVLRRLVGDELVWKSLGGDFTITFARSPFQQATFHVPAGGKIGSGDLLPDAHGPYNYEISGISLAKSADPTLIVKP
jgi:hypothetical protein